MDRFLSFLFLLKWRVHDRVKYRSRILSWLLIGAWFATPIFPRRWRFLLTAHRQAYGRFAERRIARHIEPIVEYSGFTLALDEQDDVSFHHHAIILKRPVHGADGGLIEKGVLLAKFTNSFVHLYRHFDIPALLRNFYLVLEPSWSGYARPEILAWRRFGQPILVQASEPRDHAFLERVGGNLIPIGLGSSNWVDHRVFRPVSGQVREYDAVMVGDGSLTKRTHAYLRAVSRIPDPRYRCALVVGNWGNHKTQILSLIDYYGVADRVVVFNRMSQEALNVLFNQSKVNVLLSLKEGSNRVLFEGFFAGVPGLLLRENIGVNKAYFNDQTGLIVDELELPRKLQWMKENWARFHPRQWAMEHIDYRRSTETVASKLASIARDEGLGFTGPLFEKVNVPEANYPDDRGGAMRQRLLREYLDEFALDARDDNLADGLAAASPEPDQA